MTVDPFWYGQSCVLVAVAILQEVADMQKLFLSGKRIVAHGPFVSRKQDLTFHGNPLETICMNLKCQPCFLGRIRKMIQYVVC